MSRPTQLGAGTFLLLAAAATIGVCFWTRWSPMRPQSARAPAAVPEKPQHRTAPTRNPIPRAERKSDAAKPQREPKQFSGRPGPGASPQDPFEGNVDDAPASDALVPALNSSETIASESPASAIPNAAENPAGPVESGRREPVPLEGPGAQKSWESPFAAPLWDAAGWRFEPLEMRSDTDHAAARFRQSFHRLMVEGRIEPAGEPVTPLRLRLVVAPSLRGVTLSVDGRSITVFDETQGTARVVKLARLAPSPGPGRSGLLRVAATGNRLVVGWEGRVVLTCDQPASHSGRAFELVFVADETRYRISELRIEGEE